MTEMNIYGEQITYATERVTHKDMKFVLSESDSKKITRGLGYKGIVTDILTGKIFKVYGASCGIPRCLCAISVVEIK